MYGTVMIAKPAVSIDEMRTRLEKWEADRGTVVGHVDTHVMATDDGRILMAVRFESKEKYLALADDPQQSEWWEKEAMPMLASEPEWIDGEWID
jgi:hypothetical protein